MPKATPRTFLTLFYLSAAVLVLALASPVAADANEKTDASTIEDCSVPMTTSEVPPPAATSAMRVWIDPKTGAIRQPTAEERKGQARRYSVDSPLNRSSEGLVVEHRADGAKYVHLQGRFMHAMVVTRAEDGTLVPRCVDGSHTSNESDEEAAEEPPVR